MSSISLAQHKATLQRLEALASNLELKPPERECARGTVSGVEVRLELVAKTELVARASIPAPLPTGLQIESEEARGTPYSKRFQDLQVGVKAFDERVHVRALNPAAAIRFLRQEEVLKQLPTFLTEHPQARLVGDELVLPLQQSLGEEQVQRAVKELITLASALGQAGAAEEERVRRNRAESRQALPTGAPAGEATPWTGRPYRPRPSADEEQESGAAYMRGMREQYRSRRRWAIALRILPVLIAIFAAFRYGREVWDRAFPLVVMVALTAFSYAVWRCPSCEGSLATGTKGKMSVRACPHCGITLDPQV